MAMPMRFVSPPGAYPSTISSAICSDNNTIETSAVNVSMTRGFICHRPVGPLSAWQSFIWRSHTRTLSLPNAASSGHPGLRRRWLIVRLLRAELELLTEVARESQINAAHAEVAKRLLDDLGVLRHRAPLHQPERIRHAKRQVPPVVPQLVAEAHIREHERRLRAALRRHRRTIVARQRRIEHGAQLPRPVQPRGQH